MECCNCAPPVLEPLVITAYFELPEMSFILGAVVVQKKGILIETVPRESSVKWEVRLFVPV